MRTNLSIKEIIKMSKIIVDLPPTPDKLGYKVKSKELSDMLETTVMYSKAYYMFTAFVDVKDGVGEIIERRTFYNNGLLKAMAYYPAALDYVLMQATTKFFPEDEYKHDTALSAILGYDYKNNGGKFGKIEIKRVDLMSDLKFRVDGQEYTIEEFLINFANV